MPKITRQVTLPDGDEGEGEEAAVGIGDGAPDGGATAGPLGFADAGGETGGAADCGAPVAVSGPGRGPASPPATRVGPGAGRARRCRPGCAAMCVRPGDCALTWPLPGRCPASVGPRCCGSATISAAAPATARNMAAELAIACVRTALVMLRQKAPSGSPTGTGSRPARKPRRRIERNASRTAARWRSALNASETTIWRPPSLSLRTTALRPAGSVT